VTSRFLYEPQEALVATAEHMMRKSYPNFCFALDARAIAHEKAGRIAGVAVFDKWADGDVLLTVVSDGSRRWLNREFVVRTLAFPFLQCGNRRITCLVSTRNAESLRFTRKFGWTEEGRLREAGPDGEDMLVFGMLRREAGRWLPAGLAPHLSRETAAEFC
jgi:RimJ/RimL family protein N-acetyltransferase